MEQTVPIISFGVAPKESVEAARDSILQILNAGRGDKVTKQALEAFQNVLSAKNISITGNTFAR